MRAIISLIAGLVFGTGLIISGMANPAKVQNFLDLFGSWDPSLAFVMGGAIAIGYPAFYIASRMNKPLVAGEFSLPTKTDLDRRLVTGSALFGIGWGLGGFCPGPAITAISAGNQGTFMFVAAMLAGMMLANFAGNSLALKNVKA